jgi:predicted TPR repeat methyltransferase
LYHFTRVFGADLQVQSVTDADLDAILKKCPICDSRSTRLPVLTAQKSPKVRFLKCPDCLGYSAEKFPTDEFLTELYNPKIYKVRLVGKDRLTYKLARKIAAYVDTANKKEIKILDYGGYDGRLSLALRDVLLEKGFTGNIQCYVVELYEHAPIEHLTFVHATDFINSKERYDIVLASAVVEHLKNIREVMFLCQDAV